MSNELVPSEVLGTLSKVSKDTEALTKTGEFLPQVRVYGASSDLVKEGKFPMGHLGLYIAKDNVTDLGEAFDCIVIDWRPRVSVVSGDSPISFYGKFNNETGEWDCSSSEFQELKDAAMEKRDGHMAGLEYLLYIPVIERFALFYLGNPTLRRESANMSALVRKAATVKIKLIKTAKYTWHGVQVFECTTPLEVPPVEAMTAEVENFKNPKQSEVELAKEDGEARAR